MKNATSHTFHYVSACAGSGKTTTAMAAMRKGIDLGERYVVAQPTKQLIESTVSNTRNVVALGNAKINVITSDHFPGETHSAFITAINDAKADIIFTTHATLLSCWEIAGKGKWNLIIDEIPNVDVPFHANLSLTWDEWTNPIILTEAEDADAYLVEIKANYRKDVELWSRNEPQDDVIRITQAFWEMAVNRNFRLSISKADWQMAGFDGEAKLNAHGTLLPSIFGGWADVTIMGANFEHSLLNMVWSAMGVKFEPSRQITVKNAKHTEAAGKRATVHYFTEQAWSKHKRNVVGFTEIAKGLAKELDGREHIWSANNDIEDYQWRAKNGTRLKPISHGLNSYIDFDCAVFVAALNDTPVHAKWLQNSYGLDRTEIGRAKALEAAYQMVMRTNLRMADGDKPVDIYVTDRRTADYLCDLLPGSKQHFVDLEIPALGKSQRGRPTQAATKSATERMQADRDKKKEFKGRIGRLHEMLKSAANAVRDADLGLMMTFSPSIMVPDTHTEIMSTLDDVKHLLETMYEQRFKTKDENLLITGATFSPDEDSETKRGLDAFVFTQILQFDFDDSELDPHLLSRLWYDIKHVAYNSFNNGRDGLYRYRVFIPLSHPVDVDTYHMLWDTLASRVTEAGYFIGKKGQGAASGLDLSKRTPVSLMYAPCQANEKKNSFWIDNWDASVVDVMRMIDRAPVEKPEYVEVAPVDNRSEAVRNLLDKINAPRGMKNEVFEAESAKRKLESAYERALAEWQATPAGEGNVGFFKFGARLKSAGFTLQEVQGRLEQHYADSNSDAKARKVQIKSIISSLKRGK